MTKMGKLNFYVVCSLRDAPRQFMRKSNRRCFQVHVPLPLPKQLVIFGLGEWENSDITISVEVLVSTDAQAQNIGTLSSQTRCLTWEGEWNHEIASLAAERGRKGVYGKIVLTVCGEQDKDGVFSSTPLVHKKWSFPQGQNEVDLSSTIHQSTMNETMTQNCSQLGNSVCFGEIQVNKIDTSDCSVPTRLPTDKTPRRTIITKRGHLTWRSEDMDNPGAGVTQASTLKKRLLSQMNSQEEMTDQIKNEDREVSACPSKRWNHTMCLIEPDTAVLIGGETSDQNYCKDSLWKLELDNDFWFPINSSASGHVSVPPCAPGHSATYDPDSKSIFVYGGLREGLSYNELYILNTLTWKWTLVSTKGSVPTLAYHSAAFYKKELFVFGGVKPSTSSGEKHCSNALHIFNPEFGLWYQPIVEGEKPLPRFGHSVNLLSQKLIIFGGRNTATYLNNLHILDLGLMEYTAVKCENMPPLPRGFHAAVPLSDNRILVSGGCSAIGVLQDVHIFNIDTRMWTSMASTSLSSKPRAGHSIISLGGTTTSRTEKREETRGPIITKCKLLVFGGSDCADTFYNDTIKCTVEISSEE